MHQEDTHLQTENAGCDICRRQRYSGDFPPEIAVNVAIHALLHRCSHCGTLWEQNERYISIISWEEAKKFYQIPSDLDT